jgi:hypothetical protein
LAPHSQAGRCGRRGDQFDLEQPCARTVGATAIRWDHQAVSIGLSLTTHHIQPATDRVDRELCCVVVDADTHATGIGRDLVDAIRHHFAEFSINEIMHLDLVSTPFRPIVAPMFLYGPISSFCLVSIEITGASAGGPIARSAAASFAWLFDTYGSGRIGSPRVAGSSNWRIASFLATDPRSARRHAMTTRESSIRWHRNACSRLPGRPAVAFRGKDQFAGNRRSSALFPSPPHRAPVRAMTTRYPTVFRGRLQ